uniref:PHD-type domain-containing protein n=1 Tax=Emiliania huxleyi (strain CCMP1516) TaxID=280463 RepID=A0A0D3JCH4_EMIH1
MAALDVTVAEEGKVKELVQSHELWAKRATGAFVKRGCGASLLEALTHRGEPLETTAESEDGGGEQSGTTACCFCTGNDAATTSKFMIGCDACDRWYHGPCVGVDKKAADQMTEYVCLFCCRKSGTPYKYGPPEPVPKMTRRPRLRQADKIPLSIPEVEPMRRLMSEAAAWQAEASGEGSAALPASKLLSVIAAGEACEACEVEPEALPALRKVAAQFLAWQSRARAVLGGERSPRP